MNNAEIIRGIDLTIEGLTTIKNALAVADGAIAEAPKKTAKTGKAQTEAMNPPVEETEGSAEVMTGKFDVEQLKAMKYNDFKKLAASLGVKCTGTRDEIMERILALDVTITADGEAVVEETAEEEAPAKSTKSSTSKKIGKKKADEDDEPTTDEFDEQAEEIAKDTPIEEIIEALAGVDVKATKKNAVQKLAEALREGLIELDDEDEEDEDEDADDVDADDEDEDTSDVDDDADEEEDDEEDDDEITTTSYFPEYDPKGYNNPKGMSDERAEAIEAKMDEILTAYSEDNLTDEEIASYVEENATADEIDLLGDDYDEEDILKLYIELVKRTIDNDGEEHEPSDPYKVGDKNVCCAHELKYAKKSKKYICEHCGTEYEAE